MTDNVNNTDTDTVSENTDEAFGQDHVEEHQPILFKFTNKEESPWLDSVLAMFYDGVFRNRVGIMDAWNLETEQEETVLVGIELDENGKPDCFPLAKLMRAEDVKNFLSPDGKGGYYDQFDPRENEKVKEDMLPLEEAVVDETPSEE